MVRWHWDLEERVPGEVHSALDCRAPYVREASTGLNDPTYKQVPTTGRPAILLTLWAVTVLVRPVSSR